MSDLQQIVMNSAESTVAMNIPKKIYDEIGISFSRFVEIIDRDAYTPVIASQPDETTFSYIDTDGSVCDFRFGQTVLYLSDTDPDGIGMSYFKGVKDGKAIWGSMNSGSTTQVYYPSPVVKGNKLFIRHHDSSALEKINLKGNKLFFKL